MAGRLETYRTQFTTQLRQRRPVRYNRVVAGDIGASVTQTVVRGIAS